MWPTSAPPIAATSHEAKSQFVEMFGEQKGQVSSLGEQLQTISGGTPSTKHPEYYDNGTIPWLTSGEVNQGIILSTEKHISHKGLLSSSAKWIPANCVVIAMYGATAGKVGLTKIPLTTNQAVCTVLPSARFNSVYLYFAVAAKEGWMISRASGGAQPNISQNIIRAMPLPCPPRSLQDRFVAFVAAADKSKFAVRQWLTKWDNRIRMLAKMAFG